MIRAARPMAWLLGAGLLLAGCSTLTAVSRDMTTGCLTRWEGGRLHGLVTVSRLCAATASNYEGTPTCFDVAEGVVLRQRPCGE